MEPDMINICLKMDRSLQRAMCVSYCQIRIWAQKFPAVISIISYNNCTRNTLSVNFAPNSYQAIKNIRLHAVTKAVHFKTNTDRVRLLILIVKSEEDC